MSRTFVAKVTTVLVLPIVLSSVSYVFSPDFAKKNNPFTNLAYGVESENPESTNSSDDSERPNGPVDTQDTENSQDAESTVASDAKSSDLVSDVSDDTNESILWDIGSLRLVADDEGEPRELQTSVVTLICPATDTHPELQVDLVSALHIGDGEYYQSLNRLFRKYDSVLYELVANKGSRPPKPQPHRKREASSLVSSIQILLGESLGLQFQLEEVDYTAPNFVHADLTPEEFDEAMAQRKDGLLKMFGRVLGYQLASNASSESDFQLLLALFSENREQEMRRAFADSLAESEQLSAVLNGDSEEGSAIIEARNMAAIKVLREQIASGDRRIAIFYGGAHIPDLERRIVEEFHATRTALQWLTAWTLYTKPI